MKKEVCPKGGDKMPDSSKFRRRTALISDEEMQFTFNRKAETKPQNLIGEKEAMSGCKSDMCVKRHIRNLPEMYGAYDVYTFCYVSGGRFLMYTSDIRPAELYRGQLCILPPGVTYKLSADYRKVPDSPEENILVTVLIPEHAVSRIFSRLLAGSSPVAEYLGATLYAKKFKSYMILRSPGERNAALASLAFHAVEDANNTESDPTSAEFLFNSLLLDYVRADAVYDYARSSLQNADVMPSIMNYIHTHFRTVTLDDICREFHYTPPHFCTMMKKYTGSTLTEYVTGERLDFVCKQLTLTDKKIKTIVEESGYVSLEHFYRVFKKHYGISPKEYRMRFTAREIDKKTSES